MAFNIVQTQQEADNFTYKENQSTVLYTIDTKDVNIHGCNVITKTPTAGDVLCITQRYEQNSDNNGWTLLPPESQDIVWVKGDTINMDVWPIETIGGIKRRTIEPVGICYKVRNRKAYVVYMYPRDVSEGLAARYRFKVDVSSVPSSDVEVKILGLQPGDITLTVSGATSLRDFCINVNRALIENEDLAILYVACQYIGPHEYDLLDDIGFYEGDDGIMVLNINPGYIRPGTPDVYINNQLCSLSYWTCHDVIGSNAGAEYFHKNNGTAFLMEGGYINTANNIDTFYDYVKDNGRNLTNPATSPIDETDTLPVNEQAFNSSYGKVYKDAYGSYKKYVESCMMNIYGGLSGTTINRGHMYTQMLAKAKYFTGISPTTVRYLYPAARMANEDISVNCLSLEAGNWWVPSIGELAELFNGNNVDMINNVAGKLGLGPWFPPYSPGDYPPYRYISCTPAVVSAVVLPSKWTSKSYSFIQYPWSSGEPGCFHIEISNMGGTDRSGELASPILLPITAVDI